MIIARASADGRPISNWLLVYGTGIVLGEIVLVLIDIRLGAVIHGVLLTLLTAHNAFGRTPKDPQVPVLALLPLIRLLGLVMPLDVVGEPVWYILIGAPALFAIALTARAIGLSPSTLGLGMPGSIRVQVMIAALGLPIGGLLALSGADLAVHGVGDPLQGILISSIFVVLLEEVLFRGLLQYAAAIRSPRIAVVIPNVLYAAMYLGGGVSTLPMGLLGLGFSVAVARTRSLWGVIGCHLIIRVIAQLAS